MSGAPLQRIVLVDDNDADNVYHEIILRRCGFEGELRVFEEPTEALAYLRSVPDGPACLVLLDINMPGMNGFEFAQAASPLLADKPTAVLVMLTSSSSAEDREQAAQIPVIQGYLTKPLDRDSASELLAGRWPSLRAG